MSTTIRIVNATATPIHLETTVSPSLGASDWSILASTAPVQGSPTAVVQFNRDDGITSGHTWVFTTTFTLDGVTVHLEEQVTGTLVGSTMAQSMTAGDAGTGFVDTNGSKSITFKGASGAVYGLGWSLSGVGFQDIQYTVSVVEPAYRRIPPVMTQIKNVVVIMLENRSLDNVLGWLYASGAPAIVYPPGSPPEFDGIPAGAQNTYNGKSYSPQRGTQDCHTPCRVPAFDPGEPLPDVETQLYADASGNVPAKNPWPGTPSMTGFAANYWADYISAVGEVMGAYSAVELPVLNGLARAFAVSDRWFASAPTQTDPNRAFSICGTSLGAEVNSDVGESTYANANTIFNVLGSAGKSWGYAWQSDNAFGTGEITSWYPFTSYYFPRMNQAPHGTTYQSYSDFLKAAEAGTLPDFCFVEPYWGGGKGMAFDPNAWVGIQGNDYHPPAWVGPAEAALLTLFETLRKSPQWPGMLFVITFDEHGGNWDHVPPPVAVPPDGSVGNSGFTFDRLGVRVPTILVSPFVPEGMVFRAPSGHFDHTSLLATLCKWAGVDPASALLGARTAHAPTFEGVVGEHRRDVQVSISLPSGYASQGGGTGALAGLASPALEALHASGPARLDVRAFRNAMESSGNALELAGKLQGLLVTAKKP